MQNNHNNRNMSFTEQCNLIFNKAIADYHVKDDIDTAINNPYDRESVENRLYLKCWIDTVQWHYEDIIRDPHIDPIEALQLKRRIDRSNQDRTVLVEQIDSYFRQLYSDVRVLPDARLNTESPAWAIDRLSILALKIYHMREQVERTDAPGAPAAILRPSSTCSLSSSATSRWPSTSCSRTSRRGAST